MTRGMSWAWPRFASNCTDDTVVSFSIIFLFFVGVFISRFSHFFCTYYRLALGYVCRRLSFMTESKIVGLAWQSIGNLCRVFSRGSLKFYKYGAV